MTCDITKNINGEYVVKADNGQPSILFNHLKATLGNQEEALEKWASTKTPEFVAAYPREQSYLDDNGEHSMMYIIPQQEFLYFGTKEKSSSARAKDRVNRMEQAAEHKKEIDKQAKILKNTLLGLITKFKVAEGSSSRTNRYADVAKQMTSTLNSSPDAVTSILNFASSSKFYLKQAREILNKLKDQNDTNSRLEALNELGQLLIIINNLKQFNYATGSYEKSFFKVQMEGFFDEFGMFTDKKTWTAINNYNYAPDKNLNIIRNFLTSQVDKLINVTDEEKKEVLKQFDSLISNRGHLSSILDDVLKEKDALNNKLKVEYYNTLTEWLWPYVEENQSNISEDKKISKKTFNNYLKKAQKDVDTGTYYLGSLSTVDDPIAQAIRIASEQARQDAHSKTVDNMQSLGKAKTSKYGKNPVEISEYDKYLKTVTRDIKVLNDDGELEWRTISTKGIITPFFTEKLEKDIKIEREKQIQYYNKIEDDKIAKLQVVIVEDMTDKAREEAIAKLEKAKEDKDYNVRKNVSKAMNAFYETKYDVVKYKQDLINRKKKELNKDDFKLWYQNNVYQRTITAEELQYHKKNKGSVRVIHPELIYDPNLDLTAMSSYYREGRKDKDGKVIEYTVHEIYYGGEFTTPKEKYIDPRYKDLINDQFYSELYRVYNESNNKLSPLHKLKHGIIPQIEKTSAFWKDDLSLKDNASRMWNNMGPDIFDENDYHEIEQDGVMIRVSRINQNVDGTMIKTIPIKFVSLLEDSADLDTNLIETFSKFSAVTNRYYEMSKTEASARALKNIIVGNPELGINAREIIMRDATGNKVVTKIKNATTQLLGDALKEKDRKLNTLLVDFIDDVWYGDIEEKKSLNILGKEVSLNKLSNFTSKWVSIQRLAGNLDSAISNLVIGKLAIFNEALAGKFYNLSQFYEASKIINKELYDGTILKDYMQEDINQKSLYAQMMIRHDAIQGEFSNEYGIKISKKTALEMGKDFLFFSQNGMEYSIQKRSMLCVSKGYKIALPSNLIYDKTTDSLRETTEAEKQAIEQVRGEITLKYKGLIDKQNIAIQEATNTKTFNKEDAKKLAAQISKMNRDLENISTRLEDELSKTATNYFTALDAYTRDVDSEGNPTSIKVKDFLKPYFTPKEENKLRRRIQELNKRQQGIYAQFDKSQAQRHWLGKLALMFRKYLYSAYEHRFGDQKVNLALGEETYGYQRQFMNKFLSDFKTYGTWAFTKLMDGSASPAEQYAINKTLIEYSIWASFVVLFWLMRSLDDDDDEDSWAFSKTAYIVKRTEDSLSEFALPFGIGTLVRTFKNPISSITLVEQIYEVFAVIFNDPLHLGGVYERDSGLNQKGDSKFLGKLFKVLPVLRQYGKFMTPEEQIKFYTQKKTNV